MVKLWQNLKGLIFMPDFMVKICQWPSMEFHCVHYTLKSIFRGTWGAQSVKPLTLDLGSGQDLRVMGLSPASGSALSTESAYPSPSALSPILFLSKINK